MWENSRMGKIMVKEPSHILMDRSMQGGWKDGKEHGQGTWTWSNGQKDVGEFRENRHWNTTNYDKNGNILGK